MNIDKPLAELYHAEYNPVTATALQELQGLKLEHIEPIHPDGIALYFRTMDNKIIGLDVGMNRDFNDEPYFYLETATTKERY